MCSHTKTKPFIETLSLQTEISYLLLFLKKSSNDFQKKIIYWLFYTLEIIQLIEYVQKESTTEK